MRRRKDPLERPEPEEPPDDDINFPYGYNEPSVELADQKVRMPLPNAVHRPAAAAMGRELGREPIDTYPEAARDPGEAYERRARSRPSSTRHVDRGQLDPIPFLLSLSPPGMAGFLRVPTFFIHGEVIAKFERVCRGLGWLLIVCLRYCDRRNKMLSASKTTLCREAGVKEDRTLDRRLRLLCRGHKAGGLPPLLRKLPGKGVRYVFRDDGLTILADNARRTLARLQQKHAATRLAQSKGGKRGMQSRWGAPLTKG